MNSQGVNIGGIGIGHLGKHHARLLAEINGAHLVGISDVNEAAGREAAEKYNVPYFKDYRELASVASAVTVVVPTFLHHEVARF
ncbi:MAG TPA: Gfo/Idh/MocA family oxidoreductase, partial [Candidatus Rifleibacterium sp.]|nr:Gfo/Idh/MocA family oxidoreductase [Candidatus Rifleibacterium sp.]